MLLAISLGWAIGYTALEYGPQVYDMPRYKVVPRVVAFLKGSRIVATGFHIEWKDKVYILTNRHVCGNKSNLHLNTDRGIRKIISRYDKHDLCVLESKVKKGLRLATYAPAELDRIILVGHPRGFKTVIQEGRVISLAEYSYTHPIGYYTSYRIGAFAYGGNSGSPVVTIWGTVVGVLFSVSDRYPGHPSVVPWYEIKEFMEDTFGKED